MLHVADCIRATITAPTEWQRIGNQIDTMRTRTAQYSGEEKS
jgi:hypothetical protein